MGWTWSCWRRRRRLHQVHGDVQLSLDDGYKVWKRRRDEADGRKLHRRAAEETRRMCPVWLLVAVVVVGGARGAASQCWEHPSCQDLNSESGMMECLQLCRSDITDESPVVPGNAHLQPPPPPSDSSSFLLPSSSSSSQAKRSYSMEHFRWGKPVGRKRRPIKVFTSNGVEEESAEVFPGEMRRRELANQILEEEEEEKEAVEEEQLQPEKKDGSYKMKHFRWSGPPASKRYGGFMKSWEGRGQRPLLTLFKNVINKDGQ